ncbi:MFS transporter, partial [Pontimonas sp.]|nr:MFS transporter [Pontimonas sp.]
MVAVGPVLGGWLATDFTWRWAFLINIPLGVIIMAGLILFVQESRSPTVVKGVDWVGGALSVLLFGPLVFGLIEGRIYGWWSPSPETPFSVGSFVWPLSGLSVIPVALAVSLVAGIAFVFWERQREKRARAVLLDLNLFKISSFRNGSIAALIISMGEFGLLFAIPLWLQNVIGMTPIGAGLVLLFLAGGAFVASGVGGALSGKLAPARAVQIGVVLEIVGILGFGVVASTDTGWGAIAPFLFVYGIGVGLATAQLTGVIMVDVPMDKTGQGSGSQSTVRQIGSALGIAVLGTTLFTGTEVALDDRLSELSLPPASQSQVVDLVVGSAGGAIPGIAEALQAQQVDAATAAAVQSASSEAFTDGAQLSAYVAAGFLVVGFLSTFNLGGSRPAYGRREEAADDTAPRP